MKIFKLMAIALVAMLGFSSCSEDCDHEFIEIDHSADLVGIWTCHTADYAEALVIKVDGSVVSTGVEDGEYWENVAGNIVVENGTVTMTFEDGDNFKGHFDIVPGVAFSIFDENGKHLTYRYCAEDLSEEVVGMWVCTYVSTNNEDFNIYQDAEMAINTYKADGKSIFTGFVVEANDYMANVESTYKVIGDLMLESNPLGEGVFQYNAFRLTYSPNSNQLGDMLTKTSVMAFGDEVIEFNASMVRVKEGLNFTGKTYDYISAYVSNAKGKDEDFTILGHTFNIANITGDNFDMLFRSELFYIDFNANSIKQYYRLDNGQNIEIEIPITVDGNKVTLDMSNEHSAYRKVDIYMFQSANDSQLHMYMHTDAFINYFANMELYNLLSVGKINSDDTAAIAKVFADMEARIESINVSFVFKARK